MAYKPNVKPTFPPGREGIWAAIRTLREFRFPELQRECPTSGYEALRGYLLALQKAGYIQVVRMDPTHLLRLVRDCGVHAPRIDARGREKPVNGRQRMWMAMKALKAFTYRDLSLAAQVSDADARFFILWLQRAGYLSVVSRKTALPDVLKFVGTRDTGPNPPQIRKDKSVYDRNLHKVVWTPEQGRRAA